MSDGDPLRVRHLAKKNPAAVGPDTGLRTTSFASTSVVKAQWPSSLPLTRRAAKFDLFINLKAARALGLTVPPMLIARAEQVIE
jgi:putative tryptophan/tyrosine transport system substrate-binding protein